MTIALATIFTHGFVWSVGIVSVAWVIVALIKAAE
jgi:hypothetical protein